MTDKRTPAQILHDHNAIVEMQNQALAAAREKSQDPADQILAVFSPIFDNALRKAVEEATERFSGASNSDAGRALAGALAQVIGTFAANASPDTNSMRALAAFIAYETSVVSERHMRGMRHPMERVKKGGGA